MKRCLIAAILCTACAASAPVGTSAPQVLARANLRFSVEGNQYQGTAVVQRKTSQKIAAQIPSKAVKLIVTTCHREEVIDSPATNWSTTFVPTMWLENWGSCLLTLAVITERGNLMQGVIDFTSNENLPATSYCNGKTEKSPGGATFCQSRAGLLQRISFDRTDIDVEPGDGCPKPVKDGYSFQYEVAPGLCIFAFRTKTGETHRLTSRGYQVLEVENVSGATW